MVPLAQKIEELTLLFEISTTINKSRTIKDVLHPILELIYSHTSMIRGSITILNRANSEILIQDAYGLTAEEMRRGKYKVGEGITGEVIKGEKAIIIPRISDEPKFLDRTGARSGGENGETSFLCVPIKFGEEIVGTLSMDRPEASAAELDENKTLLEVIGNMIADRVRVQQEENEELERLQEENMRLHGELEDIYTPTNIIGNSKAMRSVYTLIGHVAPTESTVLIRGDSGVGKELVANAIHYSSNRRDKAFIKINCSALPDALIESELFGHEKGAFTGAMERRIGRFEAADGGTIFLDELGDIPLSTQVKILRVLQEKEIERLGSANTFKVDVRIIAATNQPLEELIKKHEFREDLFYRINVFPIHVPSLKDRRSDILLLADFFVEKFAKKNNKPIKRISTSSIDMLMSYHWPGNVRELENVIERASILCNDGVIYGFHLPCTLQTPESSSTEAKGHLNKILEKVEQEIIFDTLKMSGGNIAKAADLLGITERIMGLRVKKYEIDIKRFKGMKQKN